MNLRTALSALVTHQTTRSAHGASCGAYGLARCLGWFVVGPLLVVMAAVAVFR